MHLLTLLFVGLGSGAAALGLDMLLLRVARGGPPPPGALVVACYLGLATVAAPVVGWIGRRRGDRTCALEVAAFSALVLYTVPLSERVFQVASLRLAGPAAMVIACTGAVLVVLAAMTLARFLRGSSSWTAPALVAVGLALGLAANRWVLGHPLAPRSLGWDLAIASAVLISVVLVRFLRPARGLGVAGALVGLTVLAVTPMRTGDPPPAGGVVGAPPNLLIVVIDTLRADVFDSVLLASPEGRRLARELEGALWFDSYMAVSPWTAPSMGSMWTGLYPEEHGFGVGTGDPNRPLRPLRSTSPTLAERLQDKGYRCEAMVANSMLYPGSGIDRGFQRYEVLLPAVQTFPLTNALVQIGLDPPEAYLGASAVGARVGQRLEDLAASRQPFFLWVHLMDPHAPLRDHPELPDDPEESGLPELDRGYRREVRVAAAATAELLEQVRQLGLEHSTVTVVTADHGEMLPSDDHDSGVRDGAGRPIRYGHGHGLFEELIHVPLAVRPAGPRGATARVADLVSQVDLLPTLTELLGLSTAAGTSDSRSLAPAIRQRTTSAAVAGRTWAFAGAPQIGPPQRCVRGQRLKLIRFPGGEVEDRVFDLVEDPGERNGGDAAPRAEVRDLEDALAEHDRSLRPVDDVPSTEVAPEVLRMLEVLGYVP